MKGDCLRRSPSAWLSACSTTLVLLAAGCGGDGSSDSAKLDPAVADRLAAQSEAVAQAIAANDGCLAAARAAELRTAAANPDVPVEVRQEVERVASREFTCNPPPPPPPPPPPAVTLPSADDEDEGDRGKGRGKKGKKDKKKRGHEDADE